MPSYTACWKPFFHAISGEKWHTDLPSRYQGIFIAMRKGVEADFQKMSLHVKSPFGDGTTSEQIMEKILAFLSDKNKTREKHFYDIDFSI